MPTETNLPLLWHIPFSHFNEKVRWALDFRNIGHRRRCVGADYLFKAWRVTGHGTLPILFLDGEPIGDSTAIIAALGRRQPEPALYPEDPARLRRALELEEHLDENLGPSLRAAVVTPLFSEDPDLALRVLTTGMPDQAYRNLRPLVSHRRRDRRCEHERAGGDDRDPARTHRRRGGPRPIRARMPGACPPPPARASPRR